MAQAATHEQGGFVGSNGKVDKAVAGMTQFSREKSLIASKEGRTTLLDQESSEAVVSDTFLADIAADEKSPDPPTA
jgi:hypothetical protein